MGARARGRGMLGGRKGEIGGVRMEGGREGERAGVSGGREGGREAEREGRASKCM